MSDLVPEALLELNHWVHPVSEAFVSDLIFGGVVPSLNPALVGLSDDGSPELNVWKDVSLLEFALDWGIWDLSFDWEEIVWGVHGWLIVVSWALMVMVLSMVMLMSLEHSVEVWVSRGNADESEKSKFVHI